MRDHFTICLLVYANEVESKPPIEKHSRRRFSFAPPPKEDFNRTTLFVATLEGFEGKINGFVESYDAVIASSIGRS